MSQTLRNLSGTFKEAKAALASGKVEDLSALNDDYEDDFNMDSARQAAVANKDAFGGGSPVSNSKEDELNSVVKGSPQDNGASVVVPNSGEEDDEDVIDIDNPEDLAAKGLKRIQIEGEDEEYLMDQEGNIYDLRGNFIGTTDEDGAAESGINPLVQGVSAGINVPDQHQIVDDDDVEFEEY
jgi:hypothetical protein